VSDFVSSPPIIRAAPILEERHIPPTTAAITAGFIIYFRIGFYFKSTLLSTTCTGFFKITIARVAILITKLRVVITIISCMVDPHI
jgi:hypothetical protein